MKVIINTKQNLSIPKVSLIGAGGFGLVHGGILRHLHEAGEIRFEAVSDPQIARINEQGIWGDGTRPRLYKSYHEMLAGESPDIVIIVTPPHLHYPMAVDALDSGAYVFLEKPPVTGLIQLNELLKHPSSGKIGVNFQMLEASAVNALKRRMVSGELGEISRIGAAAGWPRDDNYYSRSNWAGRMTLNGELVFDGPATNGLAHVIHLVAYLAGEDEAAFGKPVVPAGRFLRARPIESYDFAFLAGRFEKGGRYEIATAHCCADESPVKLLVEGTGGYAFLTQEELIVTNSLDVQASFRNFIRFVTGQASRPRTRLEDCRAYLSMISGGFEASCGIHQFAPSDISKVSLNNSTVYSVPVVTPFLRAIPLSERVEYPAWLGINPVELP